ncbi:hypothetical protein DSO57_1030322 [Entomophthora muscae]|uniref:Uncharacterized protein n=1 Tax=Entomophthora muscae TaxID=34485 RepID=A0ACC2ULT4_9FUNG|nr:hypothetical protein DSO57_1030322 [Entomophthora muscae]
METHKTLRQCKSLSSIPRSFFFSRLGDKHHEECLPVLRESHSEEYFNALGSQRWGPLPSTRYITDSGHEMVLNVSQRPLRGNKRKSVAKHKASISSLTSVLSSASLSSTATIAVQPEPIEAEHGHYQKGFNLRQLDSAQDFDRILESGFGPPDQPDLTTLKLTLTPLVLRDNVVSN